MILVCYKAFQDQVTKVLSNIMGRSLLTLKMLEGVIVAVKI